MIPLFPSIFLHLILIFTVVKGEDDSIYQILKSHGLPMGLLPKGITQFDFDDTGRFEVNLDQACNAKFESELHYDRNVSGTLRYAQIEALSGITAQELFLWFPVKGIRVDVPSSGLIYFDVGVVFKQFPLSLFETPRDCMAVWDFEQGNSIQDGELLAEAMSKWQTRRPCFVQLAPVYYARMGDEKKMGDWKSYIFDDLHGWLTVWTKKMKIEHLGRRFQV